ncbi:Hsp20/alpha crystallin family protein [Marinicrinis sediminis]|uniref:Hsp20/alpha crystallin family protein n=1 Tax=Marinicrinis sediminis TaxID=1652465 RepID=A0ABW5RAW3_9BACL
MNPAWISMMKEFEQMVKNFEKSELHHQVVKPLVDMWSGPRVDVQDTHNGIKVLIEAEDVPAYLRKKWAVKVMDQQLFIRGERKEETLLSHYSGQGSKKQVQSFTRVIPLPFEVKAKPSSVQYDNGVVIVRFDRKASHRGDRWHSIWF